MIKFKIPRKAFLKAYQHLLNSDANINFIWGGRDSGKSHFIAQRLILKCLMAPYFRCLLIKKTFNTIQESQWQTIKDICDDWGISHLFTFKVAPLSIICINGNKFIARGCDDPQSIKSVKDPSDAWYEEGNQLTLDDFITVTTTLRTNKATIQQWFSFNPECDEEDYQDFWLYKNFFKDKEYNGTYEWVMEDPRTGEDIVYKYTSTHTTYLDNPKCPPERIIFLLKLKDISEYYYNIYVLGQWGNRLNDSPFVYNYDQNKHNKKGLIPDRFNELILSFDFNKNPITCLVAQYINGKLKLLEQIKLSNSDIYALCDYINANYPRFIFIVTGDATGKNSTALVQDNLNYYKVIKSKLDLMDSQFKVPTKNPDIKENQVLVNAVLKFVDVEIDEDKCKGLIFDFKKVQVLADGSIKKANRNDKSQQADALDCFRYLCNTFFKWVLKN